MSETIWQKNLQKPNFSPLKGDIKADIAVLGGGITGVTLAYLLSRDFKVCLLEKNSLGSGETSRTTAFLTYDIDCNLIELAKKYGKEKAKNIWNSAKDAIDNIEKITREEKIENEFETCPLYKLPRDKKGLNDLYKEVELANNFGFPLKMRAKDIGLFSKEYLVAENNAKFHPLKHIYNLALRAKDSGAQIYENTCVLNYNNKEKEVIIETDKGQVKANYLILATHNPIGIFAQVQTRLIPRQTYIISGELNQGPQSA